MIPTGNYGWSGTLWVPLSCDTAGVLNTNASVSVSSSGAAIEDGASAAIKATVKDYTNSNPLAVISVDTNGDPTGGSAVSISDGSDVAEGATTDVAVTGDNAGTVSAKLRGLNKLFADVWDSVNHWLKVSVQGVPTIDITKLGGTAIDTNSGNKSAGTQRVVLATDQPALSNKLLVTPDLPSGASTAAKQPALGTAGTASTDVITIQGIASMTKLLVTPDSVALPANQSVNINQVSGASPAGVSQLGAFTFGAKQTLTTTNYTSTANGSGWQSVGISSSGVRDVILRIQTKLQGAGTGYVDFYIAPSISSDTTYADGATGTEGTYTAAGRLNARYLGSIKCNGTTAVQGVLLLSDAFVTLPGKFAIIAINNSGAQASTTGGDHVFDYETVK